MKIIFYYDIIKAIKIKQGGMILNKLIDKTVLWLLCLLICIISESYVSPVISLLAATGISSAVQYFSGKKPSYFLIISTSFICAFYPPLFCTVPLLLYDALWEKRWQLLLPVLIITKDILQFNAIQLSLILIGIFLSILLYLRTSELENIQRTLHEVRDNVIEKNIVLKQKNICLTENQDNEIYLATLKERNRIAREIHDNIGHMLTRSLLQTAAMSVICNDEKQKESLNTLKETLDCAMTNVRKSVHNLHDESIDLKYAIEDCVNNISNKFTVQFIYDITGHVPKNIKLCLIGIVKESISNIVKHSKGNKIKILLIEHPAFYQLTITDNGSCSYINNNGIGLINMKDRAESVGGIISFTPSSDGFRVFLSIPKNKYN